MTGTSVLDDSDGKTYLIRHKHQFKLTKDVNMLQNLNLMNYSHHTIFKCIGIVMSHYVSTIDLNVVSSFSVFNEFDYVYQSDVLLV